MIEIIALIFICRTIGNIARNKGRAAIVYQALGVGLWFAFAFAGAVAAIIIAAVATGSEDPSMLIVYAGALLGAFMSMIFSIGLVGILPSRVDPLAHIPMDAVPVDQNPVGRPMQGVHDYGRTG